MKILIVDDCSVSLLLMKAIIHNNTSASVYVANTVDIGVSLAKSNKFDLILTDIMMPNKTGYDLAKELEGNLILAVTSVSPEDAGDKVNLFSGWCTKPIEREKFKEFLSNYICLDKLAPLSKEYLLQRGYCCNLGCVNCPYK